MFFAHWKKRGALVMMGAGVNSLERGLEMADSTRDIIAGFGQALRNRREEAGLTLQALGAKAGVHFTAIWKVEAYTRSPSLRLAACLAEALGLTVDQLLQDAKAIAVPDQEYLDTEPDWLDTENEGESGSSIQSEGTEKI